MSTPPSSASLAGPGGPRVPRILLANNGCAATKAAISYRHAYAKHAIHLIGLATPDDKLGQAKYLSYVDSVVDLPVGPSENNYGNIPLIIAIAAKAKADFINPGWGHQSENALFPYLIDQYNASAIDHSLTWLGPSSSAMRASGGKVEAMILAQALGIPVAKWSGSSVTVDEPGQLINKGADYMANLTRICSISSDASAIELGDAIGYPLMVKASEGGGGKGIRFVQQREDLIKSIDLVRAELSHNSAILLMAYLSHCRHCEVQVVGDRHGSLIAMGSRDCTVQRRNQKIIEEGPVTVEDEEILIRMERDAVKLAQCVRYEGVCTVEYLYQPASGKYYFLEINPRLQVEHTVTELLTGINLPAIQLEIARGQPLHAIDGLSRHFNDQRQFVRPALATHVIACRITSEDSNNQFRPTCGVVSSIDSCSAPSVWSYYRINNQGGRIGQYEDSQFGHIFAIGSTREEARRQLIKAVEMTNIQGDIHTNMDVLIQVLQHSDFINLQHYTNWLEQTRPTANAMNKEINISYDDHSLGLLADDMRILIGLLCFGYDEYKKKLLDYEEQLTRGSIIPTKDANNWTIPVKLYADAVEYNGQFLVHSRRSFQVVLNNSSCDCLIDQQQGKINAISIGLASRAAYGIYKYTDVSYHSTSDYFSFVCGPSKYSFAKFIDPSAVRSPVDGKLIQYLFSDGAPIAAGQTVAQIESMKMIVEVKANRSGVGRTLVEKNKLVKMGEKLMDLQGAEAEDGESDCGTGKTANKLFTGNYTHNAYWYHYNGKSNTLELLLSCSAPRAERFHELLIYVSEQLVDYGHVLNDCRYVEEFIGLLFDPVLWPQYIYYLTRLSPALARLLQANNNDHSLNYSNFAQFHSNPSILSSLLINTHINKILIIFSSNLPALSDLSDLLLIYSAFVGAVVEYLLIIFTAFESPFMCSESMEVIMETMKNTQSHTQCVDILLSHQRRDRKIYIIKHLLQAAAHEMNNNNKTTISLNKHINSLNGLFRALRELGDSEYNRGDEYVGCVIYQPIVHLALLMSRSSEAGERPGHDDDSKANEQLLELFRLRDIAHSPVHAADAAFIRQAFTSLVHYEGLQLQDQSELFIRSFHHYNESSITAQFSISIRASLALLRSLSTSSTNPRQSRLTHIFISFLLSPSDYLAASALDAAALHTLTHGPLYSELRSLRCATIELVIFKKCGDGDNGEDKNKPLENIRWLASSISTSLEHYCIAKYSLTTALSFALSDSLPKQLIQMGEEYLSSWNGADYFIPSMYPYNFNRAASSHYGRRIKANQLGSIYYRDLMLAMQYNLEMNYLASNPNASNIPVMEWIELNDSTRHVAPSSQNYSNLYDVYDPSSLKCILIRFTCAPSLCNYFMFISDDITMRGGSLGGFESRQFVRASQYARKHAIPRLYFASSMGARVILVDKFKELYKVKWDAKGENIEYLYLTERDYEIYKANLTVSELVDRLTNERHYRLHAIHSIPITYNANSTAGPIVHSEHHWVPGTGSETQRSYDENFTLTYCARAMGIGAYLARLGRRIIQKRETPLVLVPAALINRALGKLIYQSDVQLGGHLVHATNGVSDLIVGSHYSAVNNIMRWLSYLPHCTVLYKAIHSYCDPIDRPLFPLPAFPSADCRSFLTHDEGLFDRYSFFETSPACAPSVVVGRALLCGQPVGVVCPQAIATLHCTRADPADPASKAIVRTRSGCVLFPESARKLSEAIEDFNKERLPLVILANWRGFAGGQNELENSILQFGANILQAMAAFTQPIMVYLLPQATLRGGVWSVFDREINRYGNIEKFSSVHARIGIVEPEIMAAIKFRDNEIIQVAQRLESEINGNGSADNGAGHDNKYLLNKYRGSALAFADLHDNPTSKLALGKLTALIEWPHSRRVLSVRLQRKMRQLKYLDIIRSHWSQQSVMNKMRVFDCFSNVGYEEQLFLLFLQALGGRDEYPPFAPYWPDVNSGRHNERLSEEDRNIIEMIQLIEKDEVRQKQAEQKLIDFVHSFDGE